MQEDAKQGLLYAAGMVAKKMKDIDSTLGKHTEKFYPTQKVRESHWFIDGMNRGGLMTPNEPFFKDFKIMHERFKRYHPNGKLRKGKCSVSILFSQQIFKGSLCLCGY